MGNTFKDKYFVKKREVLQTNRKSKCGPEKRKFVTGIGTQRRRRVVDTGSAVGLVGPGETSDRDPRLREFAQSHGLTVAITPILTKGRGQPPAIFQMFDP